MIYIYQMKLFLSQVVGRFVHQSSFIYITACVSGNLPSHLFLILAMKQSRCVYLTSCVDFVLKIMCLAYA